MAILSYNNIANAIYLGLKDKKGDSLDSFIDNVVKFLYKKRLFSKTSIILNKLEDLINTEKGLLMVNVYTSKKLEENTKKELAFVLKNKYKKNSVIFTEIIDEKVIGGIKLETNNEIIDLTIFNKLKKLQAHLTR